jgi:hypothetical protein
VDRKQLVKPLFNCVGHTLLMHSHLLRGDLVLFCDQYGVLHIVLNMVRECPCYDAEYQTVHLHGILWDIIGENHHKVSK